MGMATLCRCCASLQKLTSLIVRATPIIGDEIPMNAKQPLIPTPFWAYTSDNYCTRFISLDQRWKTVLQKAVLLTQNARSPRRACRPT
eukprot:2759292-Amphidinium_carterae.1